MTFVAGGSQQGAGDVKGRSGSKFGKMWQYIDIWKASGSFVVRMALLLSSTLASVFLGFLEAVLLSAARIRIDAGLVQASTAAGAAVRGL